MAIDKINATALLDGGVSTADIADDAITVAKIPDGELTVAKLASTLDISGKTVTLPDDVVTTSKIVDNNITTAKLFSGFANGITEIDSWEMATPFSPGGTADITSNWGRTDDTAFEYTGTGLTQSSGIFSFPSTGKYFISYIGFFAHNGNDGFVGVNLLVTTNNSTYVGHGTSTASGNRTTSDPTMSSSSFALIDVTDTSNVKFKFEGLSLNPCSLSRVQFYCLRVGDT